jgi:hypothetical protein
MQGLIVERLPGELLVYDEERDEAHCLHAEAAAVFDLINGSRTPAELAALASEHLPQAVSQTRVEEVLAELSARHLLAGGEAAGDGLSRRDLIQRGALTGAGVAGAALITSVAAPVPAAAQTGGGECPTAEHCDVIQSCGGGLGNDCHCYESTEGPNRCGENSDCSPTCSSSSECGPNEFCAVATCCEVSICIPLCGSVQTGSRRLRDGNVQLSSRS